jgi:hypothetical protein
VISTRSVRVRNKNIEPSTRQRAHDSRLLLCLPMRHGGLFFFSWPATAIAKQNSATTAATTTRRRTTRTSNGAGIEKRGRLFGSDSVNEKQKRLTPGRGFVAGPAKMILPPRVITTSLLLLGGRIIRGRTLRLLSGFATAPPTTGTTTKSTALAMIVDTQP